MRVRTVLADVITAQMMPAGAVKGGAALKLRFGERATRFTTDLDVARQEDIELFVRDFGDALERGWNGFTGALVPRTPATPKGVPTKYVMQPYDVKLSYKGSSWCTVSLEVGHNEIGDAEHPDFGLSDDVKDLFLQLGLPEPNLVPLMRLNHQVAQKLHGLSETGSIRAHDLIDLQLITASAELDMPQLRKTCERLFAYRKQQAWPPVIVAGSSWQDLYNDQKGSLDVIPNVEDAVTWVNNLITQISNS